MATKPTDRILDWGSGGTTTDPGGAKESQGWVVDERPPAFWWNWILNSFGQWLSWAEASSDEIPETVRTRALGELSSPGSSGTTPSLVGTTTSVGIATPQAGDVTSTYVLIRFSTAFAGTAYLPTVSNASLTNSHAFSAVQLTTTTAQVWCQSIVDGSAVNPLTTPVNFFVEVKGAP